MAQHFIVPPASNKNKKIISVVRISEDSIEIMEKGRELTSSVRWYDLYHPMTISCAKCDPESVRTKPAPIVLFYFRVGRFPP